MRKSYRKFQKDDATRYQTQLRKTVGKGDYCKTKMAIYLIIHRISKRNIHIYITSMTDKIAQH